MSENCNHDCTNCSENCGERQEIQKERLNEFSSVKKVIGVVSGKGGVGKSLVTSLLASMMNKRGHKSAILDADVTGPSIPKMFGVRERASSTEFGLLPSKSCGGVEMMSVNLLLENETDPVIWRGPVIAGAVTQFWTDVIWNDIDYMFVDMPPGTGDVPLTVFQSIPVDGIIVVTSPQELVSMIVEKAVNMAKMMDIPVLGIVENMSYFVCSECNKEHKIFGDSKIEEIAEKFEIKNISKIPMDKTIATLCDRGAVEDVDIYYLENFGEFLETL